MEVETAGEDKKKKLDELQAESEPYIAPEASPVTYAASWVAARYL